MGNKESLILLNAFTMDDDGILTKMLTKRRIHTDDRVV